jgi:hypothetical protein
MTGSGSDEIRNPSLPPFHWPTFIIVILFVDVTVCSDHLKESCFLKESGDDGIACGASKGRDRRRYGSEVTQVVRVTGAVGLDPYLEWGEEFHSDVRVFLRHLA